MSAFISITASSTAKISNCSFEDGYSSIWSGAILIVDSKAEIESSTFTNLESGYAGGAISMNFASSLKLFGNSKIS